MGRVLVFRCADEPCTVCGGRRSAHVGADGVWIGCAVGRGRDVMARMRETLARCASVDVRRFGADAAVRDE